MTGAVIRLRDARSSDRVVEVSYDTSCYFIDLLKEIPKELHDRYVEVLTYQTKLRVWRAWQIYHERLRSIDFDLSWKEFRQLTGKRHPISLLRTFQCIRLIARAPNHRYRVWPMSSYDVLKNLIKFA